ncbi:MAG TPA: hypothetical protein VFZ31_06950 [Vicinamibacterales bacterium]
MTPSRRQFVASIATVPFLPQAGSAQPQRRAPGRGADPVLDQVLANLRELSAELETQPRTRRATLRAIESTLGVGATHLAAHYDGELQAALKRRQSRFGRAALTQDIVNHARQSGSQDVTHEAIDAAMARLEQRGLSGCFRDVQEVTRRVRINAPEQVQAAGARAIQFDYCADLNWMIDLMNMTIQIVCAIAILEPSPGGEITCGALSLALGLLLLQKLIWC